MQVGGTDLHRAEGQQEELLLLQAWGPRHTSLAVTAQARLS